MNNTARPSNESPFVERMKSFYEVFPYPNRPMVAAPERLRSLMTHIGFSKLLALGKSNAAQEIWNSQRALQGASVRFHEVELQKKLEILQTQTQLSAKILMVGCGTDEPLLFRTLHPSHNLVGIDLSEKSLKSARRKLNFFDTKQKFKRTFWGGLKTALGHTTLLQGDAALLLKGGTLGLFEHIQCFGVLHHQPAPKELLKAMAESLAQGGTLRLMIYSSKGRRLERRVQKRYDEVWNNKKTENERDSALRRERRKLFFWQFINTFRLRSSTHFRFKYLGLNPNTVADAFLHPSDHALAIRDVALWARECGLELVFCEGKIDDQGWVAGFEKPSSVLNKLADADEAEGLASNFIAVFKKV